MKKKFMTYAGTGVDYDSMDPFKRAAQLAGRETAGNIQRLGVSELEMSRGESVYLIEMPDCFLAHVEEGLGTKCKVADAMHDLTGRTFYGQVAQCTVAMIVNDMITLGALPLSVAMHLAVGASSWFNDEKRTGDLIAGWHHACDLAHCAWGCGETPTLKGIIDPNSVVLSGSAMGIIKPKERVIPCRIIRGDAIILIGSSGIHANGLTLAREIAGKLPDGYLTKLSDGRSYGESLLDPTIIYVPLIEDCLNAGIPIHYAVNITGHGWRKLMRAPGAFTYVINDIPEPQPVFRFIQENGPVDDREAYGNLNMGAGFALYVPEGFVTRVMAIAKKLDLPAINAGYIERTTGVTGVLIDEKRVIIRPIDGLEFKGSTLCVR